MLLFTTLSSNFATFHHPSALLEIKQALRSFHSSCRRCCRALYNDGISQHNKRKANRNHAVASQPANNTKCVNVNVRFVNLSALMLSSNVNGQVVEQSALDTGVIRRVIISLDLYKFCANSKRMRYF